ncbi:hypothetical protein GQ53DRAFT_745079 [Thozetella sp. PMI_491]|nr:hypothetical protein GQ53DRAFT_745079 [Thozetella sp. PMI_491]
MSEPFFSISTIQVKPENTEKVLEFFNRVAKATQEKEAAAKIYRYYKVEGKNEFVWIEKFDSKEDYRKHQQSEHIQGLYTEYIQYLDQPFKFYHMDTENEIAGGFDRV